MAHVADPWSDDRKLVASILAGDRAAFDLLYNTYFTRVYRFALKRIGDASEAEDVAQDVFVAVFRSLASYQGDSSLLVWIFGVTRNVVNRRFRRRRARLEPLDDRAVEVAGDEAPPDSATDARRILGRCETVIERELTPLQRRIFHLKHLRRQSIRTIADTLGKSEDAVKANLYRMRQALLDGAPGLEHLLR